MRGRPFEPGNKMGRGRPPGSRNKKSIHAELLEEHGEDIIKQALYQALKIPPDRMILKSCFERLVRIPKPSRGCFHLPSIETPEGLAKANSAIAQAVARGRIDASDGEALSRVLANQNAFFVRDFDRRLRVLEDKLPHAD